MLNKKNFVCERCGECCRVYTVILSENDIQNISSLGYSLDSFAVIDTDPKEGTKTILKREKDGCIFLSYNGGKALCKIYKNKPSICKTYPFFHKEVISCKPHDLVKGSFLYKRTLEKGTDKKGIDAEKILANIHP
jgi:Fe-S-cluster containining protein